MRSRRGRGALSVLTALAMLLVTGTGSPRLLLAVEGETAAEVKYSSYLEVKPGELKGQVLYPEGKTPAAKVPVRVWSVEEKKFVHQTTTDEKGNYKLPALKPGRYLVIFGDRVSVDLRVSKEIEGAVKPLNVIIPRGQVFFAPGQMEVELVGEEAEGAEGDRLLSSLLIFGGGAVTAVGILWAAGALDREVEKKVIVSP